MKRDINFMQVKKKELFERGFTLVPFLADPASHGIGELLQDENWASLDKLMGRLTGADGPLRELLSAFLPFTEIEYLISIRGGDPEEEDGIWHDDGSRKMAFSLSLNLHATAAATKLKGGVLEFRKKTSDQVLRIETPPFGSMIIFLTGVYDYEHRIRKVEEGRRIMVIGWCS